MATHRLRKATTKTSNPRRLVLHTPPGGIPAETPKKGRPCEVCGRKRARTSERFCQWCGRAARALEGSPLRARRLAVVLAES